MAFHRRKSTIWLTAAAAAMALVAGGAAVVAISSSDGAALADGADKNSFVDITKVKPNVKKPKAQQGATTGTFTVDCGRNENGHFNPDNFIAQPGVRNGAQHLHDYVGNLSTNADSNNKSLQKAGTTCKNGDKSAYFWPVVRIDTEDEEEPAKQPPKKDDKAQQDKDKADKAAARLECPDVASLLPEDVPDAAQAEIDKELANIEKVTDEAEKRLEQVKAQDVDNIIVGPTREKRAAILNRMMLAFSRQGKQAPDLNPAAACKVKEAGQASKAENGAENNDAAQAEGVENKKNQNNKEENDKLELEGNDGEIQRPEVAELQFRGSPVGKVVAMPKFLRILYGDAKAGQNGPKNARDSWTCTGFEDKVQLAKYPICPQGSKVKRIHDFPSCWDGKNIDSEKHREHILFPDKNSGKCPKGFKAVPQLRISLTYNIPRDIQEKGQYKVDSFPEEEHNPITDHDDFANVMSQQIMNRLVNCVNTGKKCKE
ncbi:DUF1996 domain-containing protein [Lentzea kentuckyensis]|uniref:DUF1996 domain-containing protein n=1 Tax=Lentzea kentuckyensis TaxID=360086 RepID=UPI000A3B03EF|nr:DUF1996 domain-containing protein [Lentzea kentuckyensis]